MDIKVEKVADPKKRTLPVFKEVESLLDRIRNRAFEMFSGRGFGDGHALDDWLAAEREICWPAGELVEQDKEYVLSLTLPGFEPEEISVTTTPREVIVHAKTKTERKGEEEARRRAQKRRYVGPSSEATMSIGAWSSPRTSTSSQSPLLYKMES